MNIDITEEGNIVSITSGLFDDGRVTIEVPARTNLQLSLVNGGGVEVDGVEGEIEANNVNGPVTLTKVSGTVVAHSVNGDVTAALRQVGSSPMAFTSMNGEVDVTVPPATKASLKLRSDHGDVFTDFDVQQIARPGGPVQPSSSIPRRNSNRGDRDSVKERFRIEVDRSVYGAINGGGTDLELRTYNGDVYLRKAK